MSASRPQNQDVGIFFKFNKLSYFATNLMRERIENAVSDIFSRSKSPLIGMDVSDFFCRQFYKTDIKQI